MGPHKKTGTQQALPGVVRHSANTREPTFDEFDAEFKKKTSESKRLSIQTEEKK